MNFFPARGSLLETVGRQSSSNWGDLDSVTAIWEGNTSLSPTAPKVGASGAIIGYPGFEVASTLSEVIPGGKTRIRLRFVGLFSGGTIGPVAEDSSSSEQELEFQQFYITAILNAATPPLLPFTTYQVGTISSVIRYLSQNVIFRYVAKGKVASPRFQSIAFPTIATKFVRQSGRGQSQILGARPSIVYEYLIENSGPQIFTAGGGGTGTNSIAQFVGNGPWGYSGPNIYCSQFGQHAISPSWYQCTEVWSTRYLPGTQFTV